MRTLMPQAAIVLFLVCVVTPGMAAQQRNEANAPPNHSIIRDDRGGSYFVPNELYKRYEALKSQIGLLRQAINQDRPDAESAAEDVRLLQQELNALQQEIEKVEVFVSPVREFVQTDTYEFETGKERLIVIVADGVRIESHNGNQIRCELRKSVLSQERPADDDFAQVFVDHTYGLAEGIVGLTAEQRAADEKKFAESEDAQAMTEEQRRSRQSVVDDIARYWGRYAAFQGKQINLLQVKGLTGQEGNDHMTISVRSEGGTGSMGSRWRREAKLTIYVPNDVHVAVLGCQTGVNVSNLQGSLLLTTDQSHDRDYRGSFSVDGVSGNLTIYDAPIRSISNVAGNVTIDALGEMRNGGTNHSNDMRRKYVDRSLHTTISNIGGDLTAVYLDTHLRLERIAGTLNVVNRHGATELVVDEPTIGGVHRLMSESGRIHVHGPESAMTAVNWYLLSQVGDVRVNLSQQWLEDVSFTSDESWEGFCPAADPGETDPMALFDRMGRPKQILADEDRSPGFDVLTRSGRITLEARQ